MSGFKQGAGDVARAAYGDIADTYQAVLQGNALPHASLTGDMVEISGPAQDIPQSYEAALREHQALEQADQQAGQFGLSQEAEHNIDAMGQAMDPSEPDIS